MGKLPKMMLVACVVLGVIGLTPFGGDIYYGALRPLAAVCMVLFFVTHLFESEIPSYDDDQSQRLSEYNRNQKSGK